MSKRLLYFLSGILLFFSFIFFSYLVHKNVFTQLDFNTTVRLQDHLPRRLDGSFSFLSALGRFEVMTIVLAAMFLFARRIKAGIMAFGLYISFHLIEIYGKYFVHHPPPPGFMLRTINLVPPSPFDVRTQNSYPSGHSGRALFLSVIIITLLWQTNRLSFVMKCLLTLFVLSYDVLMVTSRVYLGEHWFSDIIGGSLLGSAFGLFAGMFIDDKTEPSKQDRKKKGFFPKFKIEVKRVE